MAFSFSSTANFQVVPLPKLQEKNGVVFLAFNCLHTRVQIPRPSVITKCELTEPGEVEKSSSSSTGLSAKISKLQVGSPVVIIEAPKMLKTATSVLCLRVNAGLVKPGDVGRTISRKPMDTWAVRLSIDTCLIDGKYVKPLELDGNNQQSSYPKFLKLIYLPSHLSGTI